MCIGVLVDKVVEWEPCGGYAKATRTRGTLGDPFPWKISGERRFGADDAL